MGVAGKRFGLEGLECLGAAFDCRVGLGHLSGGSVGLRAAHRHLVWSAIGGGETSEGLVHAGLGFEHLRRGNAYGARRLWRRGIGYLEPFRRGCMGVDVDRLIADTERCLTELDRVGDGGLDRFDRSLIPRVEWLTESG